MQIITKNRKKPFDNMLDNSFKRNYTAIRPIQK